MNHHNVSTIISQISSSLAFDRLNFTAVNNLAATSRRAASSVSEETCSFSMETMCAAKGNSSTPYFFLPAS